MTNVFVSGATGNIGKALIRHLLSTTGGHKIIAGVRSPERATPQFSASPDLAFREFDFEKPETFLNALSEIEILFLLRPPHISGVEKVFLPLLKCAAKAGIQRVVFLSVQGADKNKVIPHHTIEKLIASLGFDYIFIRPSYFMQNLTTTLLSDILEHQTITLPAGKAKFNWIDVDNIGEATAFLINEFDAHKNKAFEITGRENMDFSAVANLLSDILGTTIRYKNLDPVRFYFKKRREGIPRAFVLVMIMLHFLPRFQKAPKLSDDFEKLTGKAPTSLKEFVKREKNIFLEKYREDFSPRN